MFRTSYGPSSGIHKLLLTEVTSFVSVLAGSICINVTLRGVHVNHSCRGEAVSKLYSECVFVALVIQHAPYYNSFLACPAVPYFYRFSHKRHDIGENCY
jgi:hypothetical protein